MKTYIGTKEIKARPMTRGEYNEYRGWELSADENGADEGYLVEYVDSPNSNHENHEGYISWSPKDVFERAYRENGKLQFGDALEALKRGKRIARKGWNGKNMFLFLNPPEPEFKIGLLPFPAVAKELRDRGLDKTVTLLPSICMVTAQNDILTGWLASQADMLSEDWEILADKEEDN